MSSTIQRCFQRYCGPKKGYTIVNLIGVIYTLSTITMLTYVGSIHCVEVSSQERCDYYVGFGLFVVFQSLLNMACFHYFSHRNRPEYFVRQSNYDEVRSTSSNGSSAQSGCVDETESTKFCTPCNRTVPKRCHHCPVCDYCILKNDHHCFALGGCVGYGNQRYFVVFVFWGTIGGLYGAWLVARYYNAVKIPFWPYGLLDYFFPVAIIKWVIFQNYPFTDLGYALLITAGYVAGSGALVFFIFQCVLILKGHTMMEMHRAKKKKLPLERRPARTSRRIEEVFGPYWYVNFLIPLPFKNRMDDSLKKFLYEYQLKGV